MDHKRTGPDGQPLTKGAVISREANEAIRMLAKLTWQVTVWLNPNGVMTVNCTARQEVAPKCALRIRNGEFYIEEIERFIDEATEASGASGK